MLELLQDFVRGREILRNCFMDAEIVFPKIEKGIMLQKFFFNGIELGFFHRNVRNNALAAKHFTSAIRVGYFRIGGCSIAIMIIVVIERNVRIITLNRKSTRLNSSHSQ